MSIDELLQNYRPINLRAQECMNSYGSMRATSPWGGNMCAYGTDIKCEWQLPPKVLSVETESGEIGQVQVVFCTYQTTAEIVARDLRKSEQVTNVNEINKYFIDVAIQTWGLDRLSNFLGFNNQLD